MRDPIDRVAQLQHLKKLRDDLTKNIAEMQSDISDEDLHFARVVRLCSNFKEGKWTVHRIHVDADSEDHEAFIRLFDDSPEMKEAFEQVDSQLRVVSAYTAPEEPFDVWRHAVGNPSDHDSEDDTIVGGFTVHGSIANLRRLCQEASLGRVEYDDSEVIDEIRQHEEVLTALRLRHERGKGDAYFLNNNKI